MLSRSYGEILRALKELENTGVISFGDREQTNVRLNAGFDIPVLNSIAIELKLSSWKKALWQATRNGSQFASSYVIMPSNKLDLLNSKVDLFASNNVKVAVFDIESLSLTPIYQEDSNKLVTSRYYLETLDCLIRNKSAFQSVNFSL